MHPLVSICIPTYDRADLLDYTLERLGPVKDCGWPVEIVVSDNGSTDHTPAVIASHVARNPLIRAFRMPREPWCRRHLAQCLLEGKGRADGVSRRRRLTHFRQSVPALQQSGARQDLVAISRTDRLGRSGRAGDPSPLCRSHRIHQLRANGATQSDQFHASAVLSTRNRSLPARGADSRAFVPQPQPTLLSETCIGSLASAASPSIRCRSTASTAFSRTRFQRTHWANMAMQFHMIGDELRLALEEMVLMAVQDEGASYLPPIKVRS